MKTLFGKIFLCFFGAQVVIGAVLFAIAVSQRNNAIPQRAQALLFDNLSWRASTAALLLRHGQLEELKLIPRTRPADAGQDSSGTTVIMLHRPGRPLQTLLGPGNDLQPEFLELAKTAAQGSRMETFQSARWWGGAMSSALQSGEKVVVVQQMPRLPPRSGGLIEDTRTSEGRLRILVLVTLMALVCLGLARHLTAPVSRLRTATHRLAAGDFSARVDFKSRGGDELISLGQDFDRMAARLESSMEAERRLLGDISHELRSPLARLCVALDLVDQSRARLEATGQSVPESTYLGALERIRRESERLNNLVARLLELARLENTTTGDPTQGSETFSLEELVAEIVADARYEARSRDCEVELHSQGPCTIRGSRLLWHSAIENVLRNAVRYTAPGTAVEVRVGPCQGEGGRHAITVRDHGPGVPPETLPRLFGAFYRVDTGRDRQSGGVGLGLAIAERALRVHGAQISAHNASGGGLQVEIHFPTPESHKVI